LKQLSFNERTQCGYFCFFHQLEKIYKDDTHFSCSYVPPLFSLSSQFSFGEDKQVENKVWDQIIQVVVVETFCATNDRLPQEHNSIEQVEQHHQSENKLVSRNLGEISEMIDENKEIQSNDFNEEDAFNKIELIKLNLDKREIIRQNILKKMELKFSGEISMLKSENQHLKSELIHQRESSQHEFDILEERMEKKLLHKK